MYLADDVKEVTVTDSLEWVSNDIDGIAFVFHVNATKDHEEWILKNGFYVTCVNTSFLCFPKRVMNLTRCP
jgi:hypothetical protein